MSFCASESEKCPITPILLSPYTLLLFAFVGFFFMCKSMATFTSCVSPVAYYACAMAALCAVGGLSHAYLPWFAEELESNPFAKRTSRTHSHTAQSVRDIELVQYTALRDVPQTDWDSCVPQDKLFLRHTYLRALEDAPPPNATMFYGIAYRDKEPVAVAYFQLLTLSENHLGRSIDAKWINRLLHPVASLQGKVDKDSPIRLLLCGNALASGEFGFHSTSELTSQEAYRLLGEWMQKTYKDISKNEPIALLALKDFHEENKEHTTELLAQGYKKLSAEPAMVVQLREEWENMDDYMSAMSSKYRKRVRSARKKGASLVRQSLCAEEIVDHQSELQALFDAVVEQADFRLSGLTTDTFVEMKKTFPERFALTTYTSDEQLVGFTVTYRTEEELEAHFVGLDYEYNLPLSLYQNMLYDFVEEGIQHRCKRVQMGRTALEIKSTVGAEPQELAFYVRHPNSLFNTLLGGFVSITPQTEWIQRRPFKA